MNAECLAYMFTILGIRIEIFSPFSRLRPYHRENTGSRLLRGQLSLFATTVLILLSESLQLLSNATVRFSVQFYPGFFRIHRFVRLSSGDHAVSYYGRPERPISNLPHTDKLFSQDYQRCYRRGNGS